jgi:hypothetical protein
LGNPAGSVGFWSKHLLNDEKNERVEVKEIAGLLAQDLPSALREMQGVAAGSRSHGNFMYQANINPRDDEHLTPEQWMEAVDTLEKNLGLEGHQRVAVEHEKNGRQHYHVIWNRVDVDTMRVVDMGGNYPTHERTARELELRFGLTLTPSSDREHQPAWELWEARAAERSGIQPKDIKAELTDIWQRTDNGQAFTAAIEERGYVLAQGDRRDFVVVDRVGDAHSLARRLDGVNTRQVREKIADIDRDALPFVEEARETQRERHQDRDGPAPDSMRGQEGYQEYAAAEKERVEDPAVGHKLEKSALMVLDAATGVADTLMSFITGVRKPPVPENPNAAEQLDLIKQQRKAKAALERMQDSIEAGEHLAASDVNALTATHIEHPPEGRRLRPRFDRKHGVEPLSRP